jgi:hypothetical protein
MISDDFLWCVRVNSKHRPRPSDGRDLSKLSCRRKMCSRGEKIRMPDWGRMVGTAGLEPATPALSRRCSNQLSYAPEMSALMVTAPSLNVAPQTGLEPVACAVTGRRALQLLHWGKSIAEVAEEVGFEPTCRLSADQSLSKRCQ